MTTATNNLAAGKVQVGLSLKPGQAPASLLIGQSVEAFGVGTGSGCAAASAGGGAGGTGGGSGGSGGSGAGSGVPITTGVIASVVGSTASNGSTAAVTLAVPDADAGVLACYASAGDVAIALTPGSG
jgi:hypothetical protein